MAHRSIVGHNVPPCSKQEVAEYEDFISNTAFSPSEAGTAAVAAHASPARTRGVLWLFTDSNVNDSILMPSSSATFKNSSSPHLLRGLRSYRNRYNSSLLVASIC